VYTSEITFFALHPWLTVFRKSDISVTPDKMAYILIILLAGREKKLTYFDVSLIQQDLIDLRFYFKFRKLKVFNH